MLASLYVLAKAHTHIVIALINTAKANIHKTHIIMAGKKLIIFTFDSSAPMDCIILIMYAPIPPMDITLSKADTTPIVATVINLLIISS